MLPFSPAQFAVEPHPFLGRAHLKVVEGKAHPERALKCAIDTWNKAVMEDEEYDD